MSTTAITGVPEKTGLGSESKSEGPGAADAYKHRRLVSVLALVLMFTVGVQTFHVVEHLAQMVQEFILKADTTHGLVGQLDLEIVHFIFNTVYALGFLTILAIWVKVGRSISTTFGLTTTVLAVGLFSQTYHQIEHTVRYIQYLETGQQGTPGLIGDRFNQIVAHFLLNGIVYLPILWVYLFEGFHLRLIEMLPRFIARRWA